MSDQHEFTERINGLITNEKLEEEMQTFKDLAQTFNGRIVRSVVLLMALLFQKFIKVYVV